MAIGTAAALIGSAVIGAGASALSASKNSKAIDKSTAAQTESNAASVALQRDIYGQNKAALAPYQAGGLAAFDQTNAMLGLAPTQNYQQQPTQQPNALAQFGGGQNFGIESPYMAPNGYGGDYGRNEDLANWGNGMHQNAGPMGAQGGQWWQPQSSQSPWAINNAVGTPAPRANPMDGFKNYIANSDYGFQFGEGANQINSGYAGRGVLQSGAAMKGLEGFRQNLQAGYRNEYMDRLGGQAQMGLGAASAQAGVGQSFANNVTNLNSQNANALASAAIAKANNSTGLINGLGQTFGNVLGEALTMPYGLNDPGQIGMNALAAFDKGREVKRQEDGHNALSTYAVNPDAPGSFETLAKYHPQLAIQERERREKAQQAAQVRRLTAAAGQGDKGAILALWGVDPDMAMKLDDRQTKAALDGFKFVGDAAYAIVPLPEEQRGPARDQAIDQGVAMGLTGLAQYKGKYSPQALQWMVARAGEMKPFMEFQQPNYEAVGERGLAGFQYGKPIQQGGVAQDFGNVGQPPAAAIAELRADPGAAAEFDQVFGQGASARYLGGSGGNVTGGFRPVGIPGEQITSTKRSAAHNSAVGGVPNSYHLSGKARDSVPPRGMSMAAYAAQLQRLNPGLQVINEGDHVHMEPR